MATDPEGWNEHQTISALSPSPSVSAFSPSLELSPIMLGHQFLPSTFSASPLQSLSWRRSCCPFLTVISEQGGGKKDNTACLCMIIAFDILSYINFVLNCCRYRTTQAAARTDIPRWSPFFWQAAAGQKPDAITWVWLLVGARWQTWC